MKHKSTIERIRILSYLKEHTLTDTMKTFGVSEQILRAWDMRYNENEERLFGRKAYQKINEENFLRYMKENSEASCASLAYEFRCSRKIALTTAKRLGYSLKMKTNATPELRDAIKANPDKTLAVLAEELGVKPRILTETISFYDIPRKNITHRNVEPEEISSYINSHPTETLDQVGKIFGVSRQYICYLVEYYNIGYKKKKPWSKKKLEDDKIASRVAKYAREHPTESYRSLAKKFSLRSPMISRILKERGIQKQHVRKFDEKECRKLLLAGNTYQRIADILHISIATVIRAASEFNLLRRKH